MDHSPTECLPFQPIEEGEEHLCRALWISVVVQAFIDAGGNGSAKGDPRDRQAALAWLESASEKGDFAFVCDLAGLDFRATRRRLQNITASKFESVDFRCLTKAWGKTKAIESRARFFNRARKNALSRQQAFLMESAKRPLPVPGGFPAEPFSA